MNAKVVFRTVCWVLMIGVAVYCGYTCGWSWAVAGFVGTWLLLIVLTLGGAFAWAGAAMYLPVPRWFARPIYLKWKKDLQAKHKENPIHPLVDFPLSMYIEMQLDQEFEKGGWSGAQAALKKWLDDIPNRMTKMVEVIAKAKTTTEASHG